MPAHASISIRNRAGISRLVQLFFPAGEVLHPGCARLPEANVFCQCWHGLFRPGGDTTRKNVRVLDALSRALGIERQHRMGCVTQQYHPPDLPI
jgi:hypothetical protein